MMDAADAYIELYDVLDDCAQPSLITWATSEVAEAVASEACSAVEAEGKVPEEGWGRWLPNGPARTEQAMGVLLGLDRALLNADPARDALTCRALGELRSRLAIYGRLNSDQGKGILLFRRATPHRPNIEPQSLDGFLNLIRISAPVAARLSVRLVPEVDDLPDLEDNRQEGELQPVPQLPVAQLPMLAEPADLIWDRIDAPPCLKHYSVRPSSSELAEHVPQALDQLDSSGAVLALLPEAALDDDLLAAWRFALGNTPCPKESHLTWLLLGTGPVANEGPHISGPRPPNRAVLVHRNGHLLLTQDKQRGFCFTKEQQRKYGVDLGYNRDEYITQGQRTSLLESRHGRFAVHICEDLNRADLQWEIIKSGTTHLMVPVLAAAMWAEGWQAQSAFRLAEESGTDVAISNGLAIQRFYNGNPAPTLLVCSVPASREDYLSRDELVKAYFPDRVPDNPRTDALTARKANW